MMAPRVFRATIHGVRTLPSRKVVQIVVEAPIEELAHIASVAEHGAWVAVARIHPAEAARPPEKAPEPKTSQRSISQRAGALSANPIFWAFMGAIDEEDCAQRVRDFCGVKSRSEIKPGTTGGDNWSDLLERFRGWEAAGRAGAPQP